MNDFATEELARKVELYLVQSGEKDRLKGELSNRLMEGSWRTKVQQRCEDSLLQKSAQPLNIEHLVSENLPYALESVPESIKAEFMHRINEIINKAL